MMSTNRAIFLALALTIVSLILIYPPMRIVSLAGMHSFNTSWILLICWLLPISARILHERKQQTWSRRLSAIVMTWVGICFVALCILLPMEIVLLSGLVPEHVAARLILFCVLLISFYGIYNAYQLHIRSVEVALAPIFSKVSVAPGTTEGPESLPGFKIVQISDVHIGSRHENFLNPIVQKVNDQQADMVVITGDLIDMLGISQSSIAKLGEINAPTYFCIGNHERYVDLEDICQRLRALNITVLRNQSVTHGAIQLIGIDDAESRGQVRQQLEKIEPLDTHFRILLYHRPDGAQDAADWGVDLMLCGHTHRGQIMPFNFLVKRVFPQYYRSYHVDNLHLYVSPGTGTWGPVMRLGSKCEITLFTLM